MEKNNLSSQIQGKILDALSILFLASVPIWVFFTPEQAGFKFEHEILIVFSFFFSLRYVNNPKAFAIRISISMFLACCLAFTGNMVLEIFYGSDNKLAFLVLWLFFYVFIPVPIAAFLGFFCAKIYLLIVNQLRLSKKAQTIIIPFAFILIVATYWLVVGKDISNHIAVSEEIDKRSDFLKGITKVIGSGKNEYIDNDAAIRLGIVHPFYKYNKTAITHGYGGAINIKTNNTGVYVEYLDVPGGDPCFWFSFMNSVDWLGFKQTTVDGKLVKIGSNTFDHNKIKKELCFSGQKKVTIRYEATFEQLKYAYKFMNL